MSTRMVIDEGKSPEEKKRYMAAPDLRNEGVTDAHDSDRLRCPLPPSTLPLNHVLQPVRSDEPAHACSPWTSPFDALLLECQTVAAPV